MPDAGTAAAGAAAAAAGGATAAGDGPESSRHRHRTQQQGDAERPEPGAAAPQTSSGVLGESRLPISLSARCGFSRKHRGQVDVMLGN